MDFLNNIIAEDIIYALGWTVIHSVWQAMLIALIMAFIMPALQKKSAKYRYELAGLSLFLVLVAALSTFLYLYDQSSNVETFVTTTVMITGESPLITPDANIFEYSAQTCIDYFNEHLPLIVLLWLVGMCFFLLKMLSGFAYIQHLKHNYHYPLSPEWQNRLAVMAKKIPIKKSVEFAESALVKVPMVFGFFKPIILLPLGAINGLTGKEVEAIIAHELAHIHRNDYILNILFSFIETLFYFNPAVWWISANIRTERENCCDDVAIKLCGDSLSYAKALLSLQEMSASAPGLAMTFSSNKNQLLNRVKRILNQPQNKSNIMEKLAATCFLLFAIVSLSFSYKVDNYLEVQTIMLSSNMDRYEKVDDIDKEEENTASLDMVFGTDKVIQRTTSVKKDSIPKNSRQRIVKKTDNENVEMIIEKGEITKLKIDGEVIPKEEYGAYNELTEQLTEELSTPPSPPAPPSMRSFPPAPPAPPAPPTMMPPTAPVPPAPPGRTYFKTQTEQTVTTTTDEDGNTIIFIQSDRNGDPMEISIDNDDNQTIYIDGKKIEIGDSISISIDNAFNSNSFFNSNGDHDIIAFHGDLRPFDEATFELDKNTILDKEELMAEVQKQLLEQEAFLEKNFEDKEMQKAEILRLMEEVKITRQEALERAMDLSTIERDRIKVEKKRLKEKAYRFKNDRKNKQLKDAIENHLLLDRLIKNRKQYSFDINQKRLKINGKKQSKAIYKKYLRIFKRFSSHVKDKFEFQIKINEKNTTISRSIHKN